MISVFRYVVGCLAGRFSASGPDFGVAPVASLSTLNFLRWSTKLGGTLRATKNMTHIDHGPGPGWNYGETVIFTFWRFWSKTRFFPKKQTEIR